VWGNIVTFTKIFTVYQIYHNWVYPLHHFPSSSPPPLPGKVPIVLIFPFTYMCAWYFHNIHPPMPFPHLLPTPTGSNPARQDCSTLLFTNFNRQFISTGVLILSTYWCSYVWFISVSKAEGWGSFPWFFLLYLQAVTLLTDSLHVIIFNNYTIIFRNSHHLLLSGASKIKYEKNNLTPL
jgi:hypothetical protein